MDLIQFSRVVVYQMIYNPYTLAQCPRRVLRVGQPHDVEVYYPQYGGAFETFAAKLMALKLRSGNQVSGREISDVFFAQGGSLDFQGLLQMQIRLGMKNTVTQEELENIFADAAKGRHAQEDAAIKDYRRKFGHDVVVDATFTVSDDENDDDEVDSDDETTDETAPTARVMALLSAPEEEFDEMAALIEFLSLMGTDNLSIDDLLQPISHTGVPLMPGKIVEQTENSVTFEGAMRDDLPTDE